MSKWRLKSFKSSDSLKHVKVSSIGSNSLSHEELPILLDHEQELRIMGGDPNDPRKFPVIEAAESRTGKDSHPDDNNNFRKSSYEFWNYKEEKKDGNDGFYDKQLRLSAEESSFSKMNGQILNKKRNNGSEIALDLDLDMDDLKQDHSVVSRESRRVSFETGVSSFQFNGNDSMRHQTQQQEGRNERSDDVLRRVSNASRESGISLIRRSGLLSRMRSTKSRLIDMPQEDVEMMSSLLGKSGPVRSGLLGKGSDVEEEDDPFADEDVPDEFRRANLNALTLLQWVSLILIVGALLCSLFIPSLKRLYVWELKLWKWIQDTLFNQYVIETLSGPPLIETQRIEDEDEMTAAEISRLQNAGHTVPSDLRDSAFPVPKSGRLQKTVTRLKTMNISQAASKNNNGIGIEHLHKLNHKNISAWNMKRLMKMVRYGTLSTLDEQIMDQPSEDDSVKQIRNEYEATAAAKKIFQNVARRGSKFIYLEDLMRFMREDEALRTMSIFEGASEKRRISKSSLKNWVVNAYRERRALALTLNDTKTAVNKLHRMVNFVAGTIIAVIWLVMLEIASSRIIVLFSSQLVLAAFIFGNTCKTIFESIIFLFIIHPFDVGDRCEIDGVQFVVEEMNILTTVFLRYDNMKMIFPNSVLSTKPIGNFYRSPDMGDAIDFYIHIATPVEKVALMKQRIISYIENRKEHWCSAPMVILKEIDELYRIKMAVWLTHKMNYQDIGERWERRARLAEEMVNIFKELDMQYRLPPIDIHVCSMPNSIRIPSTWTTAESSAD
ncbi:hypothetical protein CRYUN_Cryun18bG0123100 [Craigia yunnanensis]